MKYLRAFSMVVALALIMSCNSIGSKKIKETEGLMYVMVYDSRNMPLQNVQVLSNNKLIAETDIQGRCILAFSKSGNYELFLKKDNYEAVTQVISFDPMNILYFRMTALEDLLLEAEQLCDQNKIKESLVVLDRIEKIKHDHPDALFLRLVLFYKLHQYEDCLQQISFLRKKLGQNTLLEKTEHRILDAKQNWITGDKVNEDR